MGMQLGGGGGRRGRRALNAEINVTPFVDVMLVLLIVFMITAPLVVRGEEVNLPRTQSGALPAVQEQPLTITIMADGAIRLQQTEVDDRELIPRLVAITDAGYEELIYLRGDSDAALGRAVEVLARVRAAGFTRIAIVTQPIDAPAAGRRGQP